MDDRELLELAAKAANIPFDWCGSGVAINHGHGECGIHKGKWVDVWNPLNDDALALRLAVKLKMNIFHAANKCYAMDYEGDFESIVSHASDPYAATRRAIVRSAAEIGRVI